MSASDRAPCDDRLSRALAGSPELVAYERWLETERPTARTAPRDYLFLDERPRFEPRADDVVVALPGLAVRERAGRVCLVSTSPAAEIPLPDVPHADAERILAALDGVHTLVEVRWRDGVDAAHLGRFLRAAFGRVAFAPEAVRALEAQLSACELVRFPASPYAVVRPYWENMIDVRAHLGARAPALTDGASVLGLLRELHVLALVGASFERFYKPASPASDEAVWPGTLWHAEARLVRTPRGTIFVSGPRVLAPLVGGRGFFVRLATALGDPEAAAPERPPVAEPLPWGELVWARGERDPEPKSWFVPPRPLRAEHFAALGAAWLEAEAATARGDQAGARAALAHFHWRFVRLHPFRCANQSLAMNLVNALLGRTGGAGIPHLALDHLALRLRSDAYATAFARAADAYAPPTADPAERLGWLRERTRRALALMDRVSACADAAAADGALDADPEGAVAALLAGPTAR
ncbi:MAG: hypothetical protein IT373_17215 [Polyangiaceae bacterium]|nr:hypothetical protein [Polyangiaceae bacterium]